MNKIHGIHAMFTKFEIQIKCTTIHKIQTKFKEKIEEGGYQWIDIVNPSKTELNEVALRFGLHPS